MRARVDTSPRTSRPKKLLSRRRLLAGAAAGAMMATTLAVHRRLRSLLSRWTRLETFSATPALIPHDPVHERRTLYVARGATPADNVDSVFDKLGGIGAIVGSDDLVLVKVNAQWWNQGMTNVAAVKRTIEHILTMPGFRGEVVVFENVHFRLANGQGLARAWVCPSERNVDVAGWNTMGALIDYFAQRGAPVSFVGLVDAAPSELADDDWHDPEHRYGVYGGDGRGPIVPGEVRDGYVWDFERAFQRRRSWVDFARTPLSWPVFVSPYSGQFIDFRAGVMRREGASLIATGQPLTWINMTTANEHAATGLTAACKSAMGIVDMSAGRLGIHPKARDYQSVHHFGAPDTLWRMAGPLAHFAKHVRTPDLYLTVAEWVGVMPAGGLPAGRDVRLAAESAVRLATVIAGHDPVAIDTYCARDLLSPLGGARKAHYDLDNPASRLSRFLREYRQVYGSGTMDRALIDVV